MLDTPIPLVTHQQNSPADTPPGPLSNSSNCTALCHRRAVYAASTTIPRPVVLSVLKSKYWYPQTIYRVPHTTRHYLSGSENLTSRGRAYPLVNGNNKSRIGLTIRKNPFCSICGEYPDTMNETPSSSPGTKPSPSLNSPALASGTKRKRNSVGKYYAVKKGFQPGIYYEWNDCLVQVTG